ncbi:hypothetical protein [Streptomyces venezuelae]|uniref:Uncharacterized protein n=1 Tax=Streptomyces venezuelae TaxID=54571 RepID=A0A5P2B7B5_STRVZ|nr:hypothetical protein [Streptomyces venezuelae]QES25897.1 hypothetical protein DEJ47_04985 [Streptomyces venezuelae]
MATRQIVCHIAVCDVCGQRPPDDYHWDDPQVAVDMAAEEADWTRIGDTLVCGTTDPLHDRARGGESPALLRPTRAAMTITYTEVA